MKIKNLFIITVTLLIVMSMILFYYQNTSAQVKSYAHIVPIDGGQGSIRFFDTSNGKLYTYDRTLQKVIRIVQIDELGQPAIIELTPENDGESRFVNPREK